jgi:hypothetical protein
VLACRQYPRESPRVSDRSHLLYIYNIFKSIATKWFVAFADSDSLLFFQILENKYRRILCVQKSMKCHYIYVIIKKVLKKSSRKKNILKQSFSNFALIQITFGVHFIKHDIQGVFLKCPEILPTRL